MGSLFRADTQLRKSIMQPDVPHSDLSSRLTAVQLTKGPALPHHC